MTETAIGLAMAGLEADEDEVGRAEAQRAEIAQAVSTDEAEARSSRVAEAVRKAREDLAGLTGRTLTLRLPASGGRAAEGPPTARRMAVFGIGYAAASLSAVWIGARTHAAWKG